jgi:ABC-type polar amino acid transport system ATPase subunit
MGVPTSEAGYTSAINGKGDHEVHKGHVVAMGGGGGEGKSTVVYCACDRIQLYYVHEFDVRLVIKEKSNKW